MLGSARPCCLNSPSHCRWIYSKRLSQLSICYPSFPSNHYHCFLDQYRSAILALAAQFFEAQIAGARPGAQQILNA